MTRLPTLALAAACAPVLIGAQQPGSSLPPVRPLGPTVAVASESLGTMVFARHLPAGVLVNDMQTRRLLLFDSTLARVTVVADTTLATANAYSGRIGGLIPYRGDSSLFVDPQSLSMLVIDPAGNVQRVMSVPRSQDAIALGNNMMGAPGFDAAGRLVYRGLPRPNFRAREARGSSGPGAFEPPEIPDSTPILRVDLATRVTDTVAFVKVPRVKFDVQRDDNGRVTISSMVNPLPTVDEWAVLSDGSIAIVRGRDYHVEFIRPDGSREVAPKIPFEWRRLTDEDKVAFIDSVKAARQRMAATAPMPMIAERQATAGSGGGRRGGDAAAGPPGEVRVMIGGGGGGAPPGGGTGGPARELTFVPASDLPDYQPAFFAGSARADMDGNLWIRTIPTKAIDGVVYDVIDARGALVDRVQVSQDRTIVGFGPRGLVYLLARRGEGPTARGVLEVARWR